MVRQGRRQVLLLKLLFSCPELDRGVSFWIWIRDVYERT